MEVETRSERSEENEDSEADQNIVGGKHRSKSEEADSEETTENTAGISSSHTLKMLGLPFKATEVRVNG